MELKTRVKVNGITNLHDARYCAGMGVEIIGFTIDEGSSQEKQVINEIISWLSGVKFAAELEFENDLVAKGFNVNYLETSNRGNISFFRKKEGLPLIFKVKYIQGKEEDLQQTLEALHPSVEFFILDAENINLLEVKDVLVSLTKKYPIFLKSGITKENVLKVIEEIKPAGIALDTGEEIKVGLNDFDELADILELLEIED